MIIKKSLRKGLVLAPLAAAVLSFSASADIRATLGANIDLQQAFIDEKSPFDRVAPYGEPGFDDRRETKLTTHTEILFGAETHLDSPIFPDHTRVGVEVLLNADTSDDKYAFPSVTVRSGIHETGRGAEFITSDKSKNARRVKFYWESDWGRFEYGDIEGATKKLQIDAGTVAVGNGGIHGDARLYLHPLAMYGQYTTPDFSTNRTSYINVDGHFVPVSDPMTFGTARGIGVEVKNAAKYSYYTPNMYGFTFGISYTNDTDVFGTVSNLHTVSEDYSQYGFGFENVFEGGFNYEGKVGDFEFIFSALGQTGDAKSDSFTRIGDGATVATEDLGGWQLGLATEILGFGVAGSYGENDGLSADLDDNKYWTIGGSYQNGPLGFSVNYMRNYQKTRVEGGSSARAEFKNLVFDLEYQLCEGLLPYLSVASFDSKRPTFGEGSVDIENDGTIVILGTRLFF